MNGVWVLDISMFIVLMKRSLLPAYDAMMENQSRKNAATFRK